MRNKQQNALLERSGCFTSSDKLVSFLYDLMRDHLPPGKVEELMKNATGKETSYTNGWLVAYAHDVAKRLRDSDTKRYTEQQVKDILSGKTRCNRCEVDGDVDCTHLAELAGSFD